MKIHHNQRSKQEKQIRSRHTYMTVCPFRVTIADQIRVWLITVNTQKWSPKIQRYNVILVNIQARQHHLGQHSGTMVDMETYGMDETSKWIPLGDGQLIPSKNNKHWSENEQHRKGRSKMETHPQKEVTELEVPMAAGWEFF